MLFRSKKQEITHIVTISDGKEMTTYQATCFFTPEICCDIIFEVKLKTIIVDNSSGGSQTCTVIVSETLDGTPIDSYTVETLNGIVYEGKAPQSEYQAPCGNTGDMICFTAKNSSENCEKEICILLDKLESGKAEDRAITSKNDVLTLSCYPNPTENLLNVSTNMSNDVTGQLTISTLYGIPIYRQKIASGQSQQEIDTSNFESGNYLLTIKDSKGGFAIQKIVILK